MIVMGHIIGPFGIYGWVKVHPYTEYFDGLLEYSSWWLSKENEEWFEVQVITGQIHGSTLNVKIKEYANRTQALKLKGMQIGIPRDQLPALPDDGNSGYYWSDLIGSEVTNLNDEKLGTVIGLFETGANDVLRIHSIDKKEILIPFIEQTIIKVDLKLSRIVVDWNKDY